MGFILKLDRTLPNFTFQILSFDELTNTIVFEFFGGEPSYNVLFSDQASNSLNGVDGFTYTTTGSKTETLTAGFGVTTIIGVITDGNGLELTDSIMVNFTTTTTEFQPIVTQIDPSNLKFGGFISDPNLKYGLTSPIYSEVPLDGLVSVNDLIIDTTINKLELLDYDDNFKYEVHVDFSIDIQYDGILSSGENISIGIPRLRLELPINTLRKTVSTFLPQFGSTSWRMYNVDSIAYELNELFFNNAGVSFNCNGIIELNVEPNNASIIENEIENINRETDLITVRLNRSIITNNNITINTITLHDVNGQFTNTNFSIGQSTRTFTVNSSVFGNGFIDNTYLGNLITVSNVDEPQYLLASGDNGLAEALVLPAFELINGSFDTPNNNISFEIVGGQPNYVVDVYTFGRFDEETTTDPTTGNFLTQLTYGSNGIKIENITLPSGLVSWFGLLGTDSNGTESVIFFPLTQTSTTTTTIPIMIPSPPSNLLASLVAGGSIGESNIDLSWTDNSNNELGFRIYRSINGGIFNLYDVVGANVINYTDSNPSIGNYQYRVTAFNNDGESTFVTSNIVNVN